ncbi:hypothetical protein [Virgibacillus sp. DJP39]|uniref:hypothetical protein n=1 Tax=Virgibacillus sp. DJP39 TaxID=3409790 RepID=UPI003BB73383
MEHNFRDSVIRKLITTFVTVTLVSITLASVSLLESQFQYNLGNQLMGWTFLYIVYVGVIVLIYGNAVSFIVKFAQKRWFKHNNWIYVSLHGLFGLANGLLFTFWYAALYGLLAALFYAFIDRWIYTRDLKEKRMRLFIIVPLVIYGILWGVLQIISPTMPPFSKQDAVEFATSGEGTIIEIFPEKIGETKQNIGNYTVTRETQVERVQDETYVVTFTERWSSQYRSGYWYTSYIVKRGQLTIDEQGGTNPPYRSFN